MKNQTKFNRVMSTVGLFLAIAIVVFAFLTLVNWSPKIGEWTGFSRFILGVIGIAFIVKIFDEI